eukprot:CAMPEP_0119328786 /NCGR_PEP_ID=MMETSP1333-20130426/74236_1 /TAXON_ID=418940 /ORGANISM="Scyphosphaera apsteinii, Strain RCC1455" /LENGTH=200 /DNA_ID=CAMNT_0007337745 /DNA_START=110 /DNA_END=714 /DNA_ORIENTATION=+
MEETTGMVRLSLRLNGSYSSVKVAAKAPKKIGYSRRRTGAKIVEPIVKHTQNIASEPSSDFLPSRPSLSLPRASPPKETPMMAAVMSPRTRKRMDDIATEGGEIAIERVQPSGSSNLRSIAGARALVERTHRPIALHHTYVQPCQVCGPSDSRDCPADIRAVGVGEGITEQQQVSERHKEPGCVEAFALDLTDGTRHFFQ